MRQVAYDERGLVPCVVQDWSTGEVLTLAYMNEQALRAHARDGRAAPVEPLARGAVAQGRNERQRAEGARAAPGLRRRHAARARGARRTGLPHRRAHLLSPRRARARRAVRGAARRSSGRCSSARASDPQGSYTVELLDDPAADRREGDGGGRGGGARRARGVRRSAWTKRRPTCSTTCSCSCAAAGRSLADAERVLDGRRS